MQGRKDYIPKMMYQLHLDELVPKDNFYRQLDAALDLHFLYKATELPIMATKARNPLIRLCFSRYAWLVTSTISTPTGS